MHMGKTECIVFSSKRKRHLVKSFNIVCNGHVIKSSSQVKYLGLKLDNCLSGAEIVNSVVSKCNSRLNFLYRYRDVLDERSRKLLAFALIQSNFDYGVSAWYQGVSKLCKRKLQVSQNKVVRFILNLGPRSHVGQRELGSLNLLCTADRAQQLMLNHMYNIFHETAPRYLSQSFVRVKSQHAYSTRSSELNFVVPISSGLTQFNMSTQGVKFWNNLPSSIKNVCVKSAFKTKVKSHLQSYAERAGYT